MKDSGCVIMNRCADLRQKEVINIADGKRLGFLLDLEINLEDGKIEALIIPAGGKILGFFGKDTEIVIPWEKIKKIGEEIILVELDDRFMRKYLD
jgi:YlmC/YmxH family sporulation protein